MAAKDDAPRALHVARVQPMSQGRMREALTLLSHQPDLQAEGLDAAFIDQFTEHWAQFEHLPASVRQRIQQQFAAMAANLSHRQGVGHGKTCPEEWFALAQWFKHINLVLVMHAMEHRASSP